MTKTPFALFLENDGPYSRKLFGPPADKEGYKEREGQDRRKRQERIVYKRDTHQEDLNEVRWSILKILLSEINMLFF